MLFNSTVFLQFFAAFLLLHFLCRNQLAVRNLLIIAASFLFYGWWDYRFLGLLIFSGLFDFAAALLIDHADSARRRKITLIASLFVNLSLLGFFKYYDFFAQSLAALLASLNITVSIHTLGIILPVGISFYTFQSMSYVIDVYRGQAKPTRNLLQYMAYVSFFPQLVAGPIQRGHHLLPQLERTLVIDKDMIAEGFWLIVWGLFKKVVMADNLAPLVELAFDNPTVSGPVVVLGTVAFALQIYGDFSGYSDIARGIAKLLGFNLIENFNFPYAATDLRDFWRRWHISLSTWLRDYLYVSLGGNRQGAARAYRNLLITMLLGGLWHGAAWNFVLWGAWHGLGLCAHRKWSTNRELSQRTPAWLGWIATMGFVLYGWLLFRAGSWDQIWNMTTALAQGTAPSWLPHYGACLLLYSAPLVFMEIWLARNKLGPLQAPAWLRGALQGAMLLAILLFWETKSVPFIYFQF
jgi:D-alanyl-lipoteichoic acid acyltransferase DltB (MBOAT superfamily)